MIRGIEWEAPEYEYHPKSLLWFWTTIVLAVLFLALAIWNKNFLFAVFVIIGEILILIWGAHTPQILKFKIDNKGIYLGEHTFYEFDDISNFSYTSSIWDGFQLIKLGLKSYFKINPSFLVPENITEKVKNAFLEKNIPEVEYEEHFVDSLQKFFGF